MARKRPHVSTEKVEAAIKAIREYHAQGRRSLKELPGRGEYGDKTLADQAKILGWNNTKLRKARQFARKKVGYSGNHLKKLYILLRENRPNFGISYVGLLVTVPLILRDELQKECIVNNWSTAELKAEIKKRFGSRRQGGRRRHVSSNPESALVQLEEMAHTWQRWYGVVTEVEEGGRKKKSILETFPGQVQEQLKATVRAIARLRDTVSAELATNRNSGNKTGK